VPFRTVYTFGGTPLAEEHALVVCPREDRLPDESFRTPASVTECAPRGNGPPATYRPAEAR